MGIPRLRKHIEERYGESFVSLPLVRGTGARARGFEHVYVDMNNVFHVVCRRAAKKRQKASAGSSDDDAYKLGEDEREEQKIFFRLLKEELDLYIRLLKPTKSVMLCVDGPPPVAKMLAQRTRRQSAARRADDGIGVSSSSSASSTTTSGSDCDDTYREQQQQQQGDNDDDDNNVDESSRLSVGKCIAEGLSALLFTPGCLFMPSVDSFLHEYAAVLVYGKGSRQPKVGVVEVSGSTVEGEGEAKIVKAIRAAQPLSRLAMERKRTRKGGGNHKRRGRYVYVSPSSLASPSVSIARSWCGANDKHVVVGSDSDLMLMLTMLETNYEEELLRWDVNGNGGGGKVGSDAGQSNWSNRSETMSRGRSTKRAGRRLPRPGDWWCECWTLNYNRRETCVKCGAPKPASSLANENAVAVGETTTIGAPMDDTTDGPPPPGADGLEDDTDVRIETEMHANTVRGASLSTADNSGAKNTRGSRVGRRFLARLPTRASILHNTFMFDLQMPRVKSASGHAVRSIFAPGRLVYMWRRELATHAARLGSTEEPDTDGLSRDFLALALLWSGCDYFAGLQGPLKLSTNKLDTELERLSDASNGHMRFTSLWSSYLHVRALHHCTASSSLLSPSTVEATSSTRDGASVMADDKSDVGGGGGERTNDNTSQPFSPPRFSSIFFYDARRDAFLINRKSLLSVLAMAMRIEYRDSGAGNRAVDESVKKSFIGSGDGWIEGRPRKARRTFEGARLLEIGDNTYEFSHHVAAPYQCNADCDQYFRSMEWVADMWRTGECPDYGHTYDCLSPHVLQVVEALASPTGPMLARSSSTPTPPALLPFEVALSVLPRIASPLLLEPLRPLLISEDSPVQDVLGVCKECDMYRAEYVACADELAAIVAEKKKMAEQNDTGTSLTSEASAQQQQQQRLSTINREESEARLKLRNAHAAYEAHKGEAHPYTPFPIARISEAAVGVVRHAFYTESGELRGDVRENEAALLAHGTNVIVGRKPVVKRGRASGEGAARSKPASRSRSSRRHVRTRTASMLR